MYQLVTLSYATKFIFDHFLPLLTTAVYRAIIGKVKNFFKLFLTISYFFSNSFKDFLNLVDWPSLEDA